jgi:hypothetical protein
MSSKTAAPIKFLGVIPSILCCLRSRAGVGVIVKCVV